MPFGKQPVEGRPASAFKSGEEAGVNEPSQRRVRLRNATADELFHETPLGDPLESFNGIGMGHEELQDLGRTNLNGAAGHIGVQGNAGASAPTARLLEISHVMVAIA